MFEASADSRASTGHTSSKHQLMRASTRRMLGELANSPSLLVDARLRSGGVSLHSKHAASEVKFDISDDLIILARSFLAEMHS